MLKLWSFMAALLGCVALHGGIARAEGGADLSLSPKRIVFGPADRAATLYIFNRGTEAATYALSLTGQVMTPDGRIRPVSEAASAPEAAAPLAARKAADELVNFTPRRVTLQPGQSQTVRLRALRPGDLAPGEYRSHLAITAVPPEDAGLTAEEAAKPSEGQLSVKIVTLFSITIPVIVRQGAPEVNAGLDSLSLSQREVTEAGKSRTVGVLSVDLVRKGANSLYGDIEIRAMKGAKPGDVVGLARGVATYTEVERRTVSVPLTVLPARGDRFQITFRDDDTRSGTALATADFVAP